MGPVKGTIRRYYTPYEVSQHNSPEDIWVSFLGSVYDLTRLIKVGHSFRGHFRNATYESECASLQANPGQISVPLIKAAGQDISVW